MDHAGGPYPGQPGDILRAESGPAERQDVLAHRARVHERLPLPAQDRPFPANACRPVAPLAIPAAAPRAPPSPASPQAGLPRQTAALAGLGPRCMRDGLAAGARRTGLVPTGRGRARGRGDERGTVSAWSLRVAPPGQTSPAVPASPGRAVTRRSAAAASG